MSAAIAAFPSPLALQGSVQARKGWTEAVVQKVNGWGLVDAELHRVSALKGEDLVHFAPAGSDFNVPAPLDRLAKAAALRFAIEWCRNHRSAQEPMHKRTFTIFDRRHGGLHAMTGEPRTNKKYCIPGDRVLGSIQAVDEIDALARWRAAAA